MGIVRVPEISIELVEFLQKTHPNSVIKPNETHEHHLRRAGFQDCIDLLQFYAMAQSDTTLTDEEREALSEFDPIEDDIGEGGFVRLHVPRKDQT